MKSNPNNQKQFTAVDDSDLRYKAEPNKSLIYDSKTNKDVCMYFDEETKDFLLNLLNANSK